MIRAEPADACHGLSTSARSSSNIFGSRQNGSLASPGISCLTCWFTLSCSPYWYAVICAAVAVLSRHVPIVDELAVLPVISVVTATEAFDVVGFIVPAHNPGIVAAVRAWVGTVIGELAHYSCFALNGLELVSLPKTPSVGSDGRSRIRT
jgi:hypothetical protein